MFGNPVGKKDIITWNIFPWLEEDVGSYFFQRLLLQRNKIVLFAVNLKHNFGMLIGIFHHVVPNLFKVEYKRTSI